jgi:RimJ/RimL family protein N-acetyltransferase
MTVLTTERLILRPAATTDFGALCRLWTDPVFISDVGFGPHTPEIVWLRLLRDIGHWQVFGYGNWAVTWKATGQYIGSAGVFEYCRDIEPAFGAPEAGWGLDPAFYGQGLAVEAMTAVLRHADQVLGIPRTVCIISPGNVRSLKLAEKLGYAVYHDGLFRNEPIRFLERLSQNAHEHV